jgi:phosphotransferase family enzyme
MVHGDFQQDQRLADGDQLTGIIDWETARIDHPFWDFGLGRWAPGCGAHMPMRGGWTSAPARWKPPFACGTRFVCSPIRAIPLSSADRGPPGAAVVFPEPAVCRR